MSATTTRRPPPAAPAAAPPPFDVERVRQEFPILHQEVRGKPLVYLDSAASSQKPRAVIDAEARFYLEDNANVHRGVHLLSERATQAYEGAREKVRRFLHAPEAREVIFVRGTTEALNLVAQTFGRQRVGEGDEILLTEMEHHSNIVPWQMLAREKGARVVAAPVDDRGVLRLDELERRMGPRTRLLAVTHVSNALGTVNPIREICALAHAKGIPVVVDGAQGVHHRRVDVRELGCDFYAFSGHKMYAPTGIGVLWGKREHLEAMPPWQGGGDMILSVSFEKTVFNELPYKLEAGTPHIAGAIGLGAAIDWLGALDLDGALRHEHEVLVHGTALLSRIPGVRLVGTAPDKEAVLSFLLGDVHPHDIGTVLDREGIAIRTGHHCAQPLMQRYGLAATARASLGLYSTRADVESLASGLEKVRRMFA
jgi:cysteine desulfurase/selenocysteine lyase